MEHVNGNGATTIEKPKRKAAKMRDMVEIMAGMQRQNDELMRMLRAQVAASSAVPPAAVPPPPPAAPAAPKEPVKLTKFQLRSMHRRDKRELRNMKTIGGMVPAKIVERFHEICIEKQIPVYDGLERALSAWIELET